MNHEVLRQKLMRYLKDEEMMLGQFVGLMEEQANRKFPNAAIQLKRFIDAGAPPSADILADLETMLEQVRETTDVVTPIHQRDRDLVREVLNGYMTGHDIGVPYLQKLIAKANNVPLAQVPLKSLQRYVTNRLTTKDPDKPVNTNAVLVGLCAKFAEGLPTPDPLAETGRGLVALYGKGATDAAGDYQCLVPEWDSLLAAAADDGFCRVTQRLPQQQFDGAMVDHAGTLIALLRDRLTMEPLQYTLMATGNRITGSCVYRLAASATAFERVKS